MKTKVPQVLAVFALIILAPVAHGQYVYKTLDSPLPWSLGDFSGIDGTNIVGSYNDTNRIQHGFLFNGSNYVTLDDPLSGSISELGNGTWATGISGSNIVGYYQNVNAPSHGFLYNGATWTTLDDPSADSGQGAIASAGTFPLGISGANIVGYYVQTNGATNGFLYDGATWTTLDYPGASATYAQGISGALVVGSFTDTNGVSHGFLLNAGTWSVLDAPASIGTYAQGVSGPNVVGYYFDSSGGYHGFFYDGSNWTTLDDPAGMNATKANGISGSNIVGNFWTNGFPGSPNLLMGRGYLYSAGAYKTLNNPLNTLPTSTAPIGIDGTNIVGSYIWAMYPICSGCSPQPWQAFRYNEGVWSSFSNPSAVQTACCNAFDQFLATPLGTLATGISGTNTVGYYFDSDYTAHGFIYAAGLWTTLDAPEAGISTPDSAFRGTFPKGISGTNIVGYFLDTNTAPHGFLYKGGAWTILDNPSAQATYPFGISGSNIVGYCINGQAHGFLYDGTAYHTFDAPQASASGFYSGTYATGISGANIVGYYYDSNSIAHGFLFDGSKWTILDDPGAGTAVGMGTFARGVSGQNIVGYFISHTWAENAGDPIANGFLATLAPAISITPLTRGITLAWPSNPLATWTLQQNPSLATPN